MNTSVPAISWLSSFGTTFLVIALAEIGDKSQLVCMTLAARHRGLPVFLGAIAAFCILNLLAVLFGAAVANWLPGWVVSSAVAVLFAIFGIQNLLHDAEEEDTQVEEASQRSIVSTTFVMIFLAEFGDKTQIAVAGLGSTADALAVWSGATLALACTTAAGVFAGQAWLKKLPVHWIHRVSGAFFLLLAALAAWHAYSG